MSPKSTSNSSALTDSPESVTVQESSRFRLDPRLQVFLLVGLTVALFLRLLRLIDLYSVNILFGDQWAIYTPLIHGDSWLTMFRWQHGPHRQGCGLFVTELVAGLSGWNTRAESYTIVGIVLAALLAAGVLKKRLIGAWNWWDIALPLIFLTPVQFETFFGAPNPAHGALPVLLLILYCLTWAVPKRAIRYSGVVLLNLLLIYTGFGLFVGTITPCLLAVVWWKARRDGQAQEAAWSASALALSLLSMASFFIGYEFQPVHPRPWLLPGFAALMLSHFCGVYYIPHPHPALLVGFILLSLVVGVGFYQTRQWLQSRSFISLTILIFMAYTLLYCLDTAFGRSEIGLGGSQAPRYATLLIPAFFGLYLHGLTLRSQRYRLPWLAMLLVLLAYGCLPLRDAPMHWYRDGKLRWKSVYLQTGSIAEASREADRVAIGFKIHPHPAQIRLQEKLDFLRQHHLNLFRSPD